MKPEKIVNIRKRIKDEWLLIDITKSDKVNQAVEGRLLAHTKDRDKIWQRAREHKGDLLVMFSGEPIPEGMIMI